MKIVQSYGGGADSFASLVWSIQHGEKPDVVAFVDVGDPEGEDPAEWPSTYRHMEEHAIPLCERNGIPFVVIDSASYPVRDSRSLYEWLKKRNQIPVAGPKRICTTIAKVERFEAWLDATFPGEEVEVWIGFEAGEEARAAKDPNAGTGRKPGPGQAVRRNRFRLIELGLCRCRCEQLIRAASFPVPRKSACVFCPYASRGDWQTFARELPEQFAQIVQLEADKPTTKKGKKLSIMGYRTLKDRDGNPTGEYRAPPLPEFILGEYKPKAKICGVCGGPKAHKSTGCSYEAEAA